jgi:ABC-type glycerol-3-phosphate transport system permease component
MKRISKIICILLLLVTVITLVPLESSAMSVVTPTQSVTSTKYFTAFPGVYEMGDGYAVIWATNFAGTGYIQYTYNGVQYTVQDERNGIVRTNDTIHVVKVPHEHLQGNTYTVYSTEVTSHQYAITNYGTTISAGPIRLKAYDGGVNDFVGKLLVNDSLAFFVCVHG